MHLSRSVIVLVFIAFTSCSALINAAKDDYYIKLGTTPEYPAKSCREIYDKNPVGHSRSGYYWVKSCEEPIKVYCDMYMTCGDIQGGWRKIADVKNGENCPSTWRNFTIPNTSINVCRAGQDTAGDYSVTYSTNASCAGGFQHFCGKVIGYQKGTTDAFHSNELALIDQCHTYLDGLSFTYGMPRKHLWTLAMGTTTNTKGISGNCPCSKYPGDSPPSFVRDYYYCDSGNSGPVSTGYFPSHLVWDGKDCGDYNCCAQAGLPYFYRKLPVVSDDIEVRLCANEAYSNEGVLVGTMELYIM